MPNKHIINDKGNRVIVVATRADGVKVALLTTYDLSEFFKNNPNTALEFVEVKDGK